MQLRNEVALGVDALDDVEMDVIDDMDGGVEETGDCGVDVSAGDGGGVGASEGSASGEGEVLSAAALRLREELDSASLMETATIRAAMEAEKVMRLVEACKHGPRREVVLRE